MERANVVALLEPVTQVKHDRTALACTIGASSAPKGGGATEKTVFLQEVRLRGGRTFFFCCSASSCPTRNGLHKHGARRCIATAAAFYSASHRRTSVVAAYFCHDGWLMGLAKQTYLTRVEGERLSVTLV